MECVSDWSKRVSNYSEDQRAFYNDMVPKINELKNIVKSQNDWQLLVDIKEDKVLIQTKKSVRGLTICRGQGLVQGSPLDIWRCLSDPSYVFEWNIGLESMKFTKKIGVNAFIYEAR